jgi:hypothetical protein
MTLQYAVSRVTFVCTRQKKKVSLSIVISKQPELPFSSYTLRNKTLSRTACDFFFLMRHKVMLQTTQSCSGKLRNVEICFHKSNTVVVSEVPNWHDFRSWSFPFRERFSDNNGTVTRQSFLLRHTTNEHDLRSENRLTTHVILVRSHFAVLLCHYFTYSYCQNWSTYILWDVLFYSSLKEVSVLRYHRPCQNPLLLAVVLKSVDANILLQH